MTRSFPVFVGINYKILRQRETDDISTGGFGCGLVQARQVVPQHQDVPSTACPQPTAQNDEGTSHPADPEKETPPVEVCMNYFNQFNVILVQYSNVLVFTDHFLFLFFM